MGMLPFDDWIYHLPDKREKVNGLHKKAVELEGKVQGNVLTLNKHLGQVRGLVANNFALLYCKAASVLPDQKLADYQTDIDPLPDMPKGLIEMNAGETISELVGGGGVTKLLFNGGKEVFKRFFSTAAEEGGKSLATESTALTEGAVETGIQEGSITVLEGAGKGVAQGFGESIPEGLAGETAENVGESVSEEAAESIFGNLTAGTLAATGIAIVFAVGLDVVLGAINGAKEAEELDKMIGDFETVNKKVGSFSDKVDGNITSTKELAVKEQERFINVMNDLQSMTPATFDYKFPTGLDNLEQFQTAQANALKQYALFVQLRNTYSLAVQNGHNPTKDQVIGNVLMTAPRGVTQSTLESYWAILAKYSDAMKKAS